MGVPRFFFWLSKTYPDVVKKRIRLTSKNRVEHAVRRQVDNLCIDCNGVFHPVVQRVVKTMMEELKGGTQEEVKESMLDRKERDRRAFDEIFDELFLIVSLVAPRKKLVLAVDGVAPQCKMVQQRQRRFKKGGNNRITPGTKWMHRLTSTLSKKINNEVKNGAWKHLEVIFSNEKCPGEGEHKIMRFIRNNKGAIDRNGVDTETYCVHGLDADLIMLSLATHVPSIYILREDTYSEEEGVYNIIDVFHFRLKILREIFGNNDVEMRRLMATAMSKVYRHLINDFIFFCFLLGNDFVPHSPSLDILEGGLDKVITIYKRHVNSKQTGAQQKILYTLLKKTNNGEYRISLNSLSKFLTALSKSEKMDITDKHSKKKYTPDSLVEKHSVCVKKYPFKRFRDFDKYKDEYYATKFNGDSKNIVLKEYIGALEWVINYYTSEILSWGWYYPYFYAPFLSDVAKALKNWTPVKHPIIPPVSPYEQLLMVFPGRSISNFLPKEFHSIPETLCEYYPKEYKIDMEGKFRDWEAISIIPFMNRDIIADEYQKIPLHIRNSEINRRGEPLIL